MSSNPAFDFPIPAVDGEEYYPNENDNNLGYKWKAKDPEEPSGEGVWSLIKQIPNPDVTKDYVDDEIQKLDDKIENITQIVSEVVEVTASLLYKFVLQDGGNLYAPYRANVQSCIISADPDDNDKVQNCRDENTGTWESVAVSFPGEFQTLESPYTNEDGVLLGGDFADVHLLKINQKDLDDNSVQWIANAGQAGGAVKIGDFIQIIKMTGNGSDPGNYGYYQVKSGYQSRTVGDSETQEDEYIIGLDFQHGSGTIEIDGSYKIRAIVADKGLTTESADNRYLRTILEDVQTVAGQVRLNRQTLKTDNDSNLVTKSYVDDKSTSSFPIGGIVAFSGLSSEVPEGWLLCNGESFNSTTYPQLKKLFPNNTLPDFRGHFLVGYGADVYGTFLGKYEQTTALPKVPFKTNSYSHSHAVNDGVYVNKDNKSANNGSQVNYTSSGYNSGTPTSMATDINNHNHDINVGGDPFTRPNCYAINWIMKAG